MLEYLYVPFGEQWSQSDLRIYQILSNCFIRYLPLLKTHNKVDKWQTSNNSIINHLREIFER